MVTTVPMSEVIATLEQLDASIEYDPNGQISRLMLVGQHVGDSDLKVLDSLGEALRRLNLIYTSIRGPGLAYCRSLSGLERLDLGANVELTDLGLAYLKSLVNLEAVRLWDTGISDKGLEYLTELKQLRWLYLSGTTVTNMGLSVLRKMPFLRGVDLRATSITDRGLKQLNSNQYLEWLDLSDTQIDGSGLNYLTNLRQLERIHVRNTQLDLAALQKFKKHHPNCEVDTVAVAKF